MENEDVILHQMEDTRTSLTEKLETLEQQVTKSVQDATDSVTQTVDAVKDSVQETVDAVRDSVQGTVTSVRETVSDSVDAVKDAFDLSGQVDRHPWLMVGGSVALGFCLGRFFGTTERIPALMARASEKEREVYPRRSPTVESSFQERREDRSRTEQAPGVTSTIWTALAPEMDRLKGLALGALMSTVRDVVVDAIPDTVGPQVSDIINDITKKIGGEPLKNGLHARQNQPQTARNT